jgi:hypothetical protein
MKSVKTFNTERVFLFDGRTLIDSLQKVYFVQEFLGDKVNYITRELSTERFKRSVSKKVFNKMDITKFMDVKMELQNISLFGTNIKKEFVFDGNRYVELKHKLVEFVPSVITKFVDEEFVHEEEIFLPRSHEEIRSKKDLLELNIIYKKLVALKERLESINVYDGFVKDYNPLHYQIIGPYLSKLIDVKK